MTLQTTLLSVLLLWVVAWQLRSIRAREAILLLASYLFYATWGIDFLSVLIASSLMNYFWGSVLRRRPTAAYLWIGIVLNLLILSFFKYLPPLMGTGSIGSWQPDFTAQIVMPVGISFWTFQGLSYLFDLYREEELDPSLLEFCLYMAFWPTVLAGPICRLGNMLPQLRNASTLTWDNVSAGSLRLIQGLCMKVVAQILDGGLIPGEGVASGFTDMRQGWGAIDVWLLGIGFGFQLFFDFAGYSHMVIGVARLFGIRLPENFDRPYLSATPSIFWTRWHMSLSYWIRDYVFLPLAATRRERWWPYIALILSMALFGLWHGAKATFILWGLYHGLLLVMHRLGQQLNRRWSLTWPAPLGPVLSGGSTFLLVSLGWIFFRADNLEQALTMYGSIFSFGRYLEFALPSSFYFVIFFLVVSYFVCAAVQSELIRWRKAYEDGAILAGYRVVAVEFVVLLAERMEWWLTPMISVLLALAVVIAGDQKGATAPFIYTLF
jgi:alginate O-acetyltransferase complex protein AlgI